MSEGKLSKEAKKRSKKPKTSLDSIAQCRAGGGGEPPSDILKMARAAQQRAEQERQKLPKRFLSRGKNIASDGAVSMSGCKPDEKMPPGVIRTEEMQVKAMYEYSSTLEEYEPTASGANDGDEIDVVVNGEKTKAKDGKNAVTHAEKQLARYHDVNDIDTPMGVTEEQCGDCRVWFREHAKKTGKEQVLADPVYVRIYKPDGTVEVYDADNSLVKLAGPKETPTANMNPKSYKGNPW